MSHKSTIYLDEELTIKKVYDACVCARVERAPRPLQGAWKKGTTLLLSDGRQEIVRSIYYVPESSTTFVVFNKGEFCAVEDLKGAQVLCALCTGVRT